MLEDRLAPASLTDLSGTLSIILDNPNENLTIAASGTNRYTLASSTNSLFSVGLTGATYSGNSSSGTLTVTSDTAISITDATGHTSVVFNDSGTNACAQSFSVDLSNRVSGGVTFNGKSTFQNGLSVTTADGNITAAPGSAINVNGSSGLSLTANAGNLDLQGSVTVNGGATLDAGAKTGTVTSSAALNVTNDLNVTAPAGITLDGAVDVSGNTILISNGGITANNPANSLVGASAGFALTLTGVSGSPAASASVTSTGQINFGSVDLSGDLTVVAGGTLTQNANLTVGGNASFTTSSGSIFLDFGNSFAGDISAAVNPIGFNDITLGNDNLNNGGLEIGTISMGRGTLTLDNFAGGLSPTGLVLTPSITEDQAGGGITTTGSVVVNVTDESFGTVNIRLDEAPNDIPFDSATFTGVVTVNTGFGDSGTVGFRNTDASASVGQLSFPGSTFSYTINNLILEFGSQSTNVNVNLATLASLPTSPGTLGVATFSQLTVVTSGNITQSAGSIVTNQLNGDGSVTFDSGSGSVSVTSTTNSFAGDISATVTGSNDITVDNAGGNTAQGFSGVTVLGSISLGSGNLTINDDSTSGSSSISEDPAAGGISMAPSPTSSATFNVVHDPSANVDLSGAKNSLPSGVSVVINGAVPTSGGPTEGNFGYRNTASTASLSQVTFTDFTIDGLTVSLDGATGDFPVDSLASASIPLATPGTFTNLAVTVGGNLVQNAPLNVTGDAMFSVLGNTSSITLTNSGNNFTASSSVAFHTPPTDTGKVSFTNTGNITLGDITNGTTTSLGTGTFTVVSETGNIIEGLNSTITQAANAQNAIFTAPDGAAIDLSGGLNNFFTGTVVFDGQSSGLALVGLEDSNLSASFSSFTTPTGTPNTETLVFDNPLTSVVLPGTIDVNLNLTAGNSIVTVPGGSVTFTGNLNLIAFSGNIRLAGVNDAGGGALGLTVNATTATITVAAVTNPLILGTVATGGSSVTITSADAISQAGGTTIIAGGSASFTTTSGAITLDQTNNEFDGDISAAVSRTGSDSITIAANGQFGLFDLTLGTITLGTGSLDVTNTASNGGITEDPAGGGVTTAGNSTATLSLAVSSSLADVDLSTAPNNIAGGASVTINGLVTGTTGSVGFRNINAGASLARLTVNNYTSVTNETISFDQTSLSVVDPITVTGTLTLTAGGPISQAQTGSLVSGGASFNVLGDFGIVLNNPANEIGGTITFSDPNGGATTQDSLTNAGPIQLGTSTLGLGRFILTALNSTAPGDITENPGATITQNLGGGAITLNAAGTTIDLSQGSKNEFSGPVTFNDTSNNLVNAGYENADPLATLPALMGKASPGMGQVTIDLDNAPVALPSLTTGTLIVTAGGNITQQSPTGAGLTVTTAGGTGLASFNAGPFGIQLTNPGNRFQEVALQNSGANAVSITASGGLIADNWSLGSGPLTVTTNGPVTEAAGTAVQQNLGTHDQTAGAVTFLTGTGGTPISVFLDNPTDLSVGPNNQLLGPIFVTPSGTAAGTVTIVDGSSLVLGTDSIGGHLSLTAGLNGSGGITQAAGTFFSVTGSLFLSSSGSINLTNDGNGLSASSTVSVNTTSGGSNAALKVFGPITMAGSTVQGTLSVTAVSTGNTPTTIGSIGQQPGALGTSSDGVIQSQGASFTAGVNGSILLADANNFGTGAVAFATNTLSLSAASGGVNVADSNPSGLVLGNVTFGSGGLTITASGDVSQALGTIAGSSSVSIINSTLTGTPINVSLGQLGSPMNMTGPLFTLKNVGDVTLVNTGNINLSPASTLSPTANVQFDAGGTVNLPNGGGGSLTLGTLSVQAAQTNLGGNITVTASPASGAGLSFTGAVSFFGAVTLSDTAPGGGISFSGNVSDPAIQPITIDLPASGNLTLVSGVWNQGTNSLSINGAGATFDIGSASSVGSGQAATFVMGGTQPTTLSLPGAPGATTTSAVNINGGGAFKVAGAVTLLDGDPDRPLALNFNPGSTLISTFAPTPGQLTLNGLNAADQINISPGAQLSGLGGSATSSPTVLTINGGGALAGTFSNPADPAGNFLMGTDIVRATYTPTTVAVAPSGNVNTTGSVTGNEVDGDGYKIAATGGAGLKVIADSAGGLDVVVVNGTAASTATITTTANGGDGFTRLDGLVFQGLGPVTVTASKTNVTGNIAVAGPLTSLTVNNFTGGTLTAGGSGMNTTSITGNVFANDTIVLPSQLSKLTLAQFGPLTAGSSSFAPSSITAARFGTITTTGKATANIPGDFDANLINTNASGLALSSANIKGTLSGEWELGGSLGTATTGVTATTTTQWNLGMADTVTSGPGVANPNGLTNVVGPLNLGTATFVTLHATGNVASITAVSLNDSFSSSGSTLPPTGVLQAQSFGKIATTGSAAANDHGNLVANITATGNAGGTANQAVGSLTVTGDWGVFGSGTGSTLLADNGNVGSISVGRNVDNVTITALTAPTGGAINSITAGQWAGSSVTARSVGTLKVTGNLPAQVFGTFVGQVTLTGTPTTATTLGTFSTASDVSASTFTIENGGIGTFSVGGTTPATSASLSSSSITLQSASPTSGGNVGTIRAGQWQGTNLTARTIGTLQVLGRPAGVTATPAFTGDMTDSSITAFEPVGQTTPGIGTFSVAGRLSGSTASPGVGFAVLANNGITTFKVGRNVTDYQVSTDSNGGTGGIGSLTAGSWDSTNLSVFSLAPTGKTATITGFATPEQLTGFTNGDLVNSDVIVAGSAGTTAPLGIGSLIVKHNLTADFFNVPGGIGTLSVTGTAVSTQMNVLNPVLASGTLGSLSAGEIQNLTLSANRATSITTTGSAALGLNGNVASSTLAVDNIGGTGVTSAPITSFSVAGNLNQSTVEVTDSITTFTVKQQVTGSTVAVAYDPANAGANVKTLSAGSWSSTTLTADSVSTFKVAGNASFGIAGNMTASQITLLGALNGTALGTFTASGAVSGSNFQVASGNVTSFTTAFFKGSTLFVGYSIINPSDPTNAVNNQTAGNWEGTFTLGSFTTTAVFNPSDAANSAGFQGSDVVAGKVTTVTLSGLNPNNPTLGLTPATFAVGFRVSAEPSATIKIGIGTHSSPFVSGSFDFFGLAG